MIYQDHHANIIGKSIVRSLRHQNAWWFCCGELDHFQRNCKAWIFRAQNRRYIDSGEYSVHTREQTGSAYYESQSVAAMVERANTCQCTADPREIYEINICAGVMNRGACQLEAQQKAI